MQLEFTPDYGKENRGGIRLVAHAGVRACEEEAMMGERNTHPRSLAKYLNLSSLEHPKNFKASSKRWNVSCDDVDFCVDKYTIRL